MRTRIAVLFFFGLLFNVFGQGEHTSAVTIEDTGVYSDENESEEEVEEAKRLERELDKLFERWFAFYRSLMKKYPIYSSTYSSGQGYGYSGGGNGQGYSESSGQGYSDNSSRGNSKSNGQENAKESLKEFIKQAQEHKSNLRQDQELSRTGNEYERLRDREVPGRYPKGYYYEKLNERIRSIDKDIAKAKELIDDIEKRQSNFRLPQDNLNSPNVNLGKGEGRELKSDSYNSGKTPSGDNAKPIYSGDNWGIGEPDAKIVITTTKTPSGDTKTRSNIQTTFVQNNTSASSSNAQQNSEKAKKYYNSAFENANKGNYGQGIKDLELQKAYTSDPNERAKIDSNIQNLKSRQDYQNNWTQVNQKIERDNYLNQQSIDFTNQVDAASNGNQLMAGSQKLGYALGSAAAGRLDVNSLGGAAVDLIGHFGSKKREKEELEAKKRALKLKIEEENRKRELERQKFVANLKRERRQVIERFPKYVYPNYLTGEPVSNYHFFVIYANEDIMGVDYPVVDISDIVTVKKYKDGTWPFENDFKADLQKKSSKPIKHILGYTDYEIASKKLGSIIEGFGRGGVKLSFVKVSNDNVEETNSLSPPVNQTTKDFWGKSISGKTTVKKTILKTEKSEKGNDFWGKSIKLSDKDSADKKDTISKEQDFWGKTIKIKD